jgi:hypothetical protein
MTRDQARALDRLARGPGVRDRLPVPAPGERCPRCHGRIGRGRAGNPCMLCNPAAVPLGAYVADLMASRPWCYWVFPGWWSIEDRGRYTVSIVIEREAGHFPTSTLDMRSLIVHVLTVAEAPNLELATLEARWLNRDRGISDRETDRIVASSLGSDTGRGERLI